MSEVTNETYIQYLLFFMGQLISIIGSSVVFFAVIWWITIESESAVFISISSALSFLPQLIMIPVAGTLSDMWDRKKTIIVSDTMQALTTFIIILSFMLGRPSLWIVIIMNSIRGVFNTFHRPAVNAIIPLMVPREKLSRLNGFRMLSSNAITILSPGISAWLLNVMTFQQILWIDVITFGLAMVPLLFISIPKIKNTSQRKEKNDFWSNFKGGFTTVKQTPGLLTLGIWSALLNFLIVPFNVLMPYFVRFAHGGAETDLALVVTGTQLGFILGSLIMTVKKKWKNHIAVIIYTGFGFCIGNFIASVAPSQNFWMIAAGRLIFGATISMGLSSYMTIMQTAVSKDKQGRIFSFDNFISTAITPISTLLAGPIVDKIGIVPVFIATAVLGVGVNIAIALTGVMKIRYTSEIEKEEKEITLDNPTGAQKMIEEEKLQEILTQA